MGQNQTTRGPQVLVHVSSYQRSILGTYFLTHSKIFMILLEPLWHGLTCAKHTQLLVSAPGFASKLPGISGRWSCSEC